VPRIVCFLLEHKKREVSEQPVVVELVRWARKSPCEAWDPCASPRFLLSKFFLTPPRPQRP